MQFIVLSIKVIKSFGGKDLKMQFIFIVFTIAIAAAQAEQDYSKYDNFDTDEILNNLRLLKSYALCFRGEGKCTPEGNDFKKWIPESVQTSCSKCSEKQKSLVAKFVKALEEKLPEEWEKLIKMYNPNGKYDKGLEEFLEKYGK